MSTRSQLYDLVGGLLSALHGHSLDADLQTGAWALLDSILRDLVDLRIGGR